MTPEERSQATKARWAALTDEQKAERLAKMRAGRTSKVAPVAAEAEAPALKIKKPKMTSEERSQAAKARWDALSDEQKAERLAKLRAGRPVAPPKEQKVKMTKEERAAATKARWAALTDEQKAEKVAKMVAGRAASRAAA
jgi:DNA repair ATPase RecN